MEIGAGELPGQKAHGGFERGAFQIRAFEIDADQAGFLEIGAHQTCVAKIGEQQVGRFQVCVLQIRVAEVDADQFAAFELGLLQIGFAAGGSAGIEPVFVIGEGFFERPFTGIDLGRFWNCVAGHEIGRCDDFLFRLGERDCDRARGRRGFGSDHRIGFQIRYRAGCQVRFHLGGRFGKSLRNVH